MTEVFSSPVLKVEQPRRGPFAKSKYRVMDGDGTVIAVADETERDSGGTFRAVFPGKSNLDARAVLLSTPDGEPLLVVDKEEGRASPTDVRRPEGDLVGSFVPKRIGRVYTVRDADDEVIGTVDVDVPRNNFAVSNPDGDKVAHVRKKWAGVVTHLLTTADKYEAEIFDPVPEPLRTMAAVTAIVMDMNLHESKDIT